MSSAESLNDKLSSYAQKLVEPGEGEAVSKRQKKRILQKLGKLKKQISQQESGEVAKVDNKRRLEDNVDESDTDKPIEKEQKTEPVLTKKEMKVKLRIVNQELADFAQKKQLKLAIKKVQWALKKGFRLEVHTYTNLINVYVRCSDMAGADSVLADMKAAGIQPNVITYTTLLKGYSELGQMEQCRRILFQDMQLHPSVKGGGPRVVPNVRSLNAFLRACARTGAVKSAYKAFVAFKRLSSAASGRLPTKADDSDNEGLEGSEGLQPDASTYEYLVGILCRSGYIRSAEAIVAEYIASSGSRSQASKASAGGVDVMENAAIYLSLAKAHALAGGIGDAKKWLSLTQSVLRMNQGGELKDSMLKRFKSDGKEEGRADKKEGSSRSVALFLSHRRQEIQNETQLLEDFIASVDSQQKTVAGAMMDLRSNAAALYLRQLSQVLYFGYDGSADYDDVVCGAQEYLLSEGLAGKAAQREGYSAPQEEQRVRSESAMPDVSGRLVVALRDKFGLDLVSSSAAEEGGAEAGRALQAERREAAGKAGESIDPQSGLIVFERLFQQFRGVRPAAAAPTSAAGKARGGAAKSAIAEMYSEIAAAEAASGGETSSDEALELPIKLEICSGNGEWVAAQAAADRGAFSAAGAGVKALWVALELRCDRVHNTLCQHLFSSQDLAHKQAVAQGGGSALSASQQSNLAIISGDAAKIIPQRFPPARLSAIFINHPQPPDRVTGGAKDKNQGTHLLTTDFFADLHRALRPDGTVTIVTDNQLYANSLAESLVDMTGRALKASVRGEAFASVRLEGDASRSLQETLLIGAGSSNSEGLCVQIWRGDPGPEAGHVTAASSYFDRMWDLGQKKRRWFIYLRRL